MNNWFLLIFLFILSCDNSYTPKPKGFSRIDFPKKEKFVQKNDMPFVFEQPVYSSIQNISNENSWFDLEFSLFKGVLHKAN